MPKTPVSRALYSLTSITNPCHVHGSLTSITNTCVMCFVVSCIIDDPPHVILLLVLLGLTHHFWLPGEERCRHPSSQNTSGPSHGNMIKLSHQLVCLPVDRSRQVCCIMPTAWKCLARSLKIFQGLTGLSKKDLASFFL